MVCIAICGTLWCRTTSSLTLELGFFEKGWITFQMLITFVTVEGDKGNQTLGSRLITAGDQEGIFSS